MLFHPQMLMCFVYPQHGKHDYLPNFVALIILVMCMLIHMCIITVIMTDAQIQISGSIFRRKWNDNIIPKHGVPYLCYILNYHKWEFTEWVKTRNWENMDGKIFHIHCKCVDVLWWMYCGGWVYLDKRTLVNWQLTILFRQDKMYLITLCFLIIR